MGGKAKPERQFHRVLLRVDDTDPTPTPVGDGAWLESTNQRWAEKEARHIQKHETHIALAPHNSSDENLSRASSTKRRRATRREEKERWAETRPGQLCQGHEERRLFTLYACPWMDTYAWIACMKRNRLQNWPPWWMFENSFAILWDVYRKTNFQHSLGLNLLEPITCKLKLRYV